MSEPRTSPATGRDLLTVMVRVGLVWHGPLQDPEVPTIELVTEILAPPARCFALSLSVDAHTGSMGDSGERAIAGVTSGVMRLGDEVTWRARHFGIPFTMTSTTQ